MSTPNIPSGAQVYTQGFGSASSNALINAIRATRAPANSDVRGPQGNYVIGQRWIDTSANGSYTLTSLSSSGGTVTATWVTDGGGSGALATLTGDSGTATPSGGNIQIAGGSGVTTSASGAVLTISLTGGGVAIDSLIPDTGTSPIVPDGTGSVQLAGTLNQITTTGGTNSLTYSLANELQSGSLTALGGIRHVTSLGTTAMPSITATDATAIGYGCLALNTAAQSTGVGSGCLAANVGGSGNTGVGYTALAANTGNQNTAMGNSALSTNVSGADSCAFGYQALTNSKATGNSAFGAQAGATITTNIGMSAFGFQALTAATGANNTAMGYQSGSSVSTGEANTLIGAGSGGSLGAGNSNVCVGQNAGSNYGSTESGNIVIGQGVTGTASENNVTRIGTEGTQTKCVIAGIFGVTVGGSGIAVDIDNTGQLGTVVSSIRYKDDILDIEGTDRIYDLRPVSFVYKASPEVRRYGLIAEEVVDVIPEMAVYGNGGSLETVRYADLPIMLLAEIQNLRAEIEALKGAR